ncbi:MAG: NAD(P)H:quinone oxidoreductase [Firmicutes bacterium ADurb.Bin182]|nr:MAG: NAD(P)H:quinone oxidoreductase [Firmicutes bacterium ADurb.Bin182]
MEIAIIHGQLHKGSTYHISSMLKDRLAEPDSVVHEYFMPADAPGFCMGCFRCIIQGESNCPHADKVQRIAESMISSDVIIIDSPTYCLEMSGQLKTLFDHLGYMWLSHRPRKEMFKKIGVVISTAAGLGAKRVTKSIAKQMFWWGIPKVFKLPVSVSAMSWGDVSDKIKLNATKKVDSLSNLIKRGAGSAKPGFATRFLFSVMRTMQSKNTWNLVDRDHWKSNGWLLKERPWR